MCINYSSGLIRAFRVPPSISRKKQIHFGEKYDRWFTFIFRILRKNCSEIVRQFCLFICYNATGCLAYDLKTRVFQIFKWYCTKFIDSLWMVDISVLTILLLGQKVSNSKIVANQRISDPIGRFPIGNIPCFLIF